LRVDPGPGRSSHAAPDIDRDVLDLVVKPHLSEPFIFVGVVRMERGRIIRSKKKPPGGFLEARTAIRCKHLASRRPPAAKQRKIGKAGSARSHPGLRESLQRPPGGKDVCHCGSHDLTILYRKLPVNDLVLLPSPKCPSSSTVAHQSRPSIFIPSAPDEPQRPSCGGGCAHGTLGQLKAEVSPAWIPIALP